MPLINETTYYYQCYGCGQKAQSPSGRKRKCPACGKLRLTRTGRASLVMGDVQIGAADTPETVAEKLQQVKGVMGLLAAAFQPRKD